MNGYDRFNESSNAGALIGFLFVGLSCFAWGFALAWMIK